MPQGAAFLSLSPELICGEEREYCRLLIWMNALVPEEKDSGLAHSVLHRVSVSLLEVGDLLLSEKAANDH